MNIVDDLIALIKTKLVYFNVLMHFGAGMIIKFFAGIIILFGLWFSFKILFSMLKHYEEPIYESVFQQKPYEIRDYKTMQQVITQEVGSRKLAIQSGFQSLFRYISGANQARKKISMTTPVLQSMSQEKWKIAFVMPRYLKKEEIPHPIDAKLKVEEVTNGRYAVIRFSGSINKRSLLKQQKNLETFVAKRHCAIIQGPIFAFYDPPWTLPFLRRNEIWFQIDKNC